jgi:molybdopterin converting factor small subunit
MSINVKIFYPELQNLIGGQDSITVEGKTVGECINDLVKRYPEAQNLLFEKNGQLLKQVYVYVNAEGLNKADFARRVTERDGLILAVLITGG